MNIEHRIPKFDNAYKIPQDWGNDDRQAQCLAEVSINGFTFNIWYELEWGVGPYSGQRVVKILAAPSRTHSDLKEKVKSECVLGPAKDISLNSDMLKVFIPQLVAVSIVKWSCHKLPLDKMDLSDIGLEIEQRLGPFKEFVTLRNIVDWVRYFQS